MHCDRRGLRAGGHKGRPYHAPPSATSFVTPRRGVQVRASRTLLPLLKVGTTKDD